MDTRRLEALSRRVGAASSRRAALAAAVVGTASLLGWGPPPVQAGLPIVNCKPPGKRCKRDQKCCTGNCRKGICQCAKRGQQCWEPLEGALCCSQRCSGGKCA